MDGQQRRSASAGVWNPPERARPERDDSRNSLLKGASRTEMHPSAEQTEITWSEDNKKPAQAKADAGVQV